MTGQREGRGTKKGPVEMRMHGGFVRGLIGEDEQSPPIDVDEVFDRCRLARALDQLERGGGEPDPKEGPR